MKYQPITAHNFKQLTHLSAEQKFVIDVVSKVLPFRSNNYVVNELINWHDIPNDPMFRLTFPQREMLQPQHFEQIAHLIHTDADNNTLQATVNHIRLELNPHPAGQLEANRPTLSGTTLSGLQHKYAQTVLFFPSQGQTCHAYCTFCFRWPQFVGMNALKFAMKEASLLVAYLQAHPEVTDLLFTGGDPLIMRTKTLAMYINALLEANIPHLQTIRLGTKALGFWPYRFLTDNDADELLVLFDKVIEAGYHLAIMAHFSHPRELQTTAVQQAIKRIRQTGAEIRTQSPLLKGINDNPTIWATMWQEQVRLGCVPYYLFVVRNTGAQHYFAVPLVKAWHIFREAYQKVSGLARTVRGPSMSTYYGKVQLLGVVEVNGQKLLNLRFLQGRDADWVLRPFLAQYDDTAIWLDELQTVDGNPFFFETSTHEIVPLPLTLLDVSPDRAT